MTEILTESFCERCGTRYTFESNAPRRSRIGRVRTLSKGLRNFVMSDESSFSEAMADARSEEELVATSHQLDAFHQTFNFCLTCRQYTCSNCWNAAEGRCLTCAPMPGMEEAPGPGSTQVVPLDGNGHAPGAEDEAWPEADLGRIAAVLGEPMPAPGAMDAGIDGTDGQPPYGADDGLIGGTELIGEPAAPPAVAAAGPSTDMPAGPVTSAPLDGQAPLAGDAFREEVARATEPAPLLGVAPGQSLEDAIAAYESQLAAGEAASEQAAVTPAEPEPVAPGHSLDDVIAAYESQLAADEAASEQAAVTPAQPEPIEPEPVVAQPAEPEPLTPTPAPAGPEPMMPAAAQGTDVIQQPTWPVPASPAPAPGAPAPGAPEPGVQLPPGQPAASPWLRVAPDDPNAAAQPQWPAAPVWPTNPRHDYPNTLAGRPLLPRDDAAALWAASAREVLGSVPAVQPSAPATPSPQPCVQCGLSLSANARFCRRCGSRQG